MSTLPLTAPQALAPAGRQPAFRTSGPPWTVPALDGLRGVAGIMVLAAHFGPQIAAPGSPFARLQLLPPFVFKGVTLFFVLSGFLITWILLASRDSPNYFRTFYARRFFRIVPLYLLVCGSYALATVSPWARGLASVDLLGSPLPLWSYFVFLQNFFMAAAGHFGPLWLAATWSLAVEEQFYLLFPAVARRLSEQRLAMLLTGVVVLAICARAFMQKYHVLGDLTRFTLLVGCADALAAGALLALALRQARAAEWLARWSGPALVVAVPLWLAYPYLQHPQAIRMAFLYPAVDATLFAALLCWILHRPGSAIARALSTPAMRWQGRLSYAVYLLHPIALGLVFYAFEGADPSLRTAADLVPLALALAATFALALLSWKFVERPMVERGHRFTYAR